MEITRNEIKRRKYLACNEYRKAIELFLLQNLSKESFELNVSNIKKFVECCRKTLIWSFVSDFDKKVYYTLICVLAPNIQYEYWFRCDLHAEDVIEAVRKQRKESNIQIYSFHT